METPHDETGASTSFSQILSEILSTSLQNRVHLLETSTMLTLQHASQLFHHLRLRISRSSRQSLLERDLGHEDHLLDHVLDEQLPEEQTACCICGTRTTRTCTVGTWCSKSPRRLSRNPSQRPSSINERLRPHPADILAVEQIEGRGFGRKSLPYLDNILYLLSSSPRRALWS